MALRFKKLWYIILVGVLIVLVAFSRMFLGAHYPSDVIAGGVLGILLAVLGNIIYDKIKNKKKLYLSTIAVLTPFAILFMINADLLYEDFYKCYGMIMGLFFAIVFEEKYAPLNYDIPWWKKILRVIIGVAIAYAIKEGTKVPDIFGVIQIYFAFDIIRYLFLVFIVCGICPLLFKACKI